ncbi:hypothetical protein D3C85_1012210 [compost metagenome]
MNHDTGVALLNQLGLAFLQGRIRSLNEGVRNALCSLEGMLINPDDTNMQIRLNRTVQRRIHFIFA